MAELMTLARPYAKAAFEYACDQNDLAGWSQMLSVTAAVVGDASVQRVLTNPTLTADHKAQSFIDLCGDQLNEKGANFIRNLASNKRLELLPVIRDLFEHLKAQREQTLDVEVQGAFPLPDAQLETLSQALTKRLGRAVNLTGTTDPSLIGGVLIRAGDTVIDGSVRARLAKLAEAMNL